MRKSDKRENKIVGIMAFVAFLAVMAFFSFLSEAKGHEREDRLYQQTVGITVRITMSSATVGSGVIIASHEGVTTILSAYHVTSDEDWIKVGINGIKYDATVVKEDEENDLSLLVIDYTTDNVAHVHDDIHLHVYDEIVTVGAGGGLQLYPSTGIITNLDSNRGTIQASAGVQGGASGGPVFVRHSNHFVLIGVMRAQGLQPVQTPFGMQIRVPVNNVLFFTSIREIKSFLAR